LLRMSAEWSVQTKGIAQGDGHQPGGLEGIREADTFPDIPALLVGQVFACVDFFRSGARLAPRIGTSAVHWTHHRTP